MLESHLDGSLVIFSSLYTKQHNALNYKIIVKINSAFFSTVLTRKSQSSLLMSMSVMLQSKISSHGFVAVTPSIFMQLKIFYKFLNTYSALVILLVYFCEIQGFKVQLKSPAII